MTVHRAAAGMPRPATMVAEPWVLSVVMLAVIVLVLGAIHFIRQRRDRRRGILMLVAAAVLLGNVLIWTLP